MDYSGGARSAKVNTPASITSGGGKVREGTSDMRIVIGLLMESNRSFAASAEDGKSRVSITKTSRVKTT
jgi:hypothetical protein